MIDMKPELRLLPDIPFVTSVWTPASFRPHLDSSFLPSILPLSSVWKKTLTDPFPCLKCQEAFLALKRDFRVLIRHTGSMLPCSGWLLSIQYYSSPPCSLWKQPPVPRGGTCMAMSSILSPNGATSHQDLNSLSLKRTPEQGGSPHFTFC